MSGEVGHIMPQGNLIYGKGSDGKFYPLATDLAGGLSAGGYTSISDGRTTCGTAGTRVVLSASTAAVKAVIITAETDNTSIMAIGGSTVAATIATRQGTPLSAGESVSFPINSLNKVWIDTTVSGDGVTYIVLT